MSYEVPSDERDRRLERNAQRMNRDLIRFSPTNSSQVDATGFGSANADSAQGVALGNFVMNPEEHIISIQLSWTGGTGTLDIGDIVDASNTAWQGKLTYLVSGNSVAGTGVFEPQNSTAFTDDSGVTLDETPSDWSGDYTEFSDNDNGIVIFSASVIVETIDGSDPTLDSIFGAKNDGQFTTIKPKEGNTLTMTSGGNIDIVSDVIIEDTTFAILQFHGDNITPDAGGNWSIVSGASGGTGTVPDGTADNQHLEWNDSGSVWEAKDFLEFNSSANPHADAGGLRFINDDIFLAGRTGADDGNIELKFTTQDEIDITNSNNSTVALLLRGQHATEADQLFLISQQSGIGASAGLLAQNNIIFTSNLSTTNMVLRSDNVLLGTEIYMNNNAIQLDSDNDSGIISLGDDVVQIFINDIVRYAFQDTVATFGGDLNMSTFDVFNVDRLLFTSSAGSFALGSDTGMVLGLNGLTYNVATTKRHDWDINQEILMTLRQTGAPLDTLLDIQANTGQVTINIFHDHIANDNAIISEIAWHSQNLASSTIQYARLDIENEQNNTGDEAGSLAWYVRDVSMDLYMTFNNNRDDKITLYKNPFLNTNVDLELNANRLYLDTISTATFIELDDTFDRIQFFTSDSANEKVAIHNAGMDLGIAGNNMTFTAHSFLRVVPTDAVPLSINGYIWYDDSEEKFKVRENGVTVDMRSGGVSDKIEEGNSSVEVVDAGVGVVQTTVDGVVRISSGAGFTGFFHTLSMTGNNISMASGSIDSLDTLDMNGPFSLVDDLDTLNMLDSGSLINMNGGAISQLDTLSFNGSGSQLNSLDTLFMLDSGSSIDLNGGDILDVDDLNMTGASSIISMNAGDIVGIDDMSFLGASSSLSMFGGDISLSGGDITLGGGDIITCNNIEIDGTLNHDGTLFGTYGVTPVVRQDVPLVGILLFQVVATLSDLLQSLQRQGLITTNV